MSKLKNLGGGPVQRAVLWHTLNEGVVTADSLAALTGGSITAAKTGLARMAHFGFTQVAPARLTPRTDRRFIGYSLTPKGIEAALRIDAARVQMAPVEEVTTA